MLPFLDEVKRPLTGNVYKLHFTSNIAKLKGYLTLNIVSIFEVRNKILDITAYYLGR